MTHMLIHLEVSVCGRSQLHGIPIFFFVSYTKYLELLSSSGDNVRTITSSKYENLLLTLSFSNASISMFYLLSFWSSSSWKQVFI